MKKFNECKNINEIIDIIDYNFLEKISYILIILWCINPIFELLFKENCKIFYMNYYYIQTIIPVIGVIGIFNFIIFYYKYIREHGFKLKQNISLLLIGLLVLLAIISTFFAEDKSIAILGDSYRKEGLIRYILYVGFLLNAMCIKDKKYLFRIFKTIIWCCLVSSLYPLLLKGESNFYNREYSNIFMQFNHYGYYLMISSFLSLFIFINEKNNYKKIIYLGVFTIILFFLIINNTFGCYLAFLITFICFIIYSLFFKWKRMECIIASIIFITLSITLFNSSENYIVKENFKELLMDSKIINNYVLNNNKESKEKIYSIGTSRGILWKYAIFKIKEKPLVGGGIECLGTFYADNKIDQDRPHNIILQIASFVGIPAAFVYIIIIFKIFLSSLKNLKEKNIFVIGIFFTGICYFISSMFGNSMFYTSPYFMIILGLLLSFNYKTEKRIK